METNEKLNPFVRIRGVKERGAEVIAELRKRGGHNHYEHSGDREMDVYLIDPTGTIVAMNREGAANFCLANYEEIVLPRWRAEKGGNYFYVTDCLEILPALDMGAEISSWHYEIGNYFETKEEAEQMRGKFLEMLKER